MSQVRIEDFLKQKIGLDAKSIGSKAIAKAVQLRLQDLGLPDVDTYLKYLQTSSAELEALTENLVVPETWFYRNREAFTYLSQYIQSEWLSNHCDTVLRVLSVPCSTGEEPYSIATTLLESGLTVENFWIDGVDISKKSIERAQRAVYTQNSFRGNNNNFQQKYFTLTAAGYQLCDSVRNAVNFIQSNLLKPNFFVEKAPYHIIFCRNLLIYFDQLARKQAVQTLKRLLVPNGLLFVGYAETLLVRRAQFVPVDYPLAFACRQQRQPQPLPPVAPYLSPTKLSPQAPIVPTQSTTSEANLLETASALADQGELAAAAALCETYLSQNRLSAEAYLLLGQVHQATGNETQAESCFEKAVYLKPDYYEALVYLALLKEHHKDLKGAAAIRRRIERLQKS